jgi:hypothetical protein
MACSMLYAAGDDYMYSFSHIASAEEGEDAGVYEERSFDEMPLELWLIGFNHLHQHHAQTP